jgi:hypothetical protein
MATKAEANAVYAAGLIQGIALVTFPAASTLSSTLSSTRRRRSEARQSWPAHSSRSFVTHLSLRSSGNE